MRFWLGPSLESLQRIHVKNYIICFGCFDLKLTSKIGALSSQLLLQIPPKNLLLCWFVIRPLKSHRTESLVWGQRFESLIFLTLSKKERVVATLSVQWDFTRQCNLSEKKSPRRICIECHEKTYLVSKIGLERVIWLKR